MIEEKIITFIDQFFAEELTEDVMDKYRVSLIEEHKPTFNDISEEAENLFEALTSFNIDQIELPDFSRDEKDIAYLESL